MDSISPAEYFTKLKEKKNRITDTDLVHVYDYGLILLGKYEVTGQTAAMRKLIFQLETIEKERQLVRMGFDSFVYRDDVEDYIDNVAQNVVKIIELSRYERDIPGEIVEKIEKTKHIFDEFYVVFTDYTGKAERQVAKERREKDPILFGTFQDRKQALLNDRFYFLGDWVDDYCDLTLDKMVMEMREAKDKAIRWKYKTPKSLQELKAQLDRLAEENGRFRRMPPLARPSVWQKVKGWFRHER